MKKTVRTFVAVEIDERTRRAATKLIEKLSVVPVDVKWVAPHNLHITLKFLGDVSLQETARICQAVQKAAVEVEPFELSIEGAGAFPTTKRPRTVWIGSRVGEDQMSALHKQLERRLAKLGFRKDSRRFQAHLTIGRVKRGGPGLSELASLIEENAQCEIGKTTISEAVVFSSELGPEGPTYHPLGRAKLGG
ncbi:MAG: RNA 2',3'-cyclic phosphodiesterase [Pirellulales bacterium]|nr:RNA 2',3'-cyclic phosphodiesterase [Pirellulales bacterium]